ncbi:MAG: hypothetical protein GC189_09405 [Alphaproteobacteria bacterium]|nr:hypothetical protein [Alphaproteobacteria bacterium]
MIGPQSRNDDGAALIAVLMMLAIVSALAILVVDAAGSSLRRGSNEAAMDQNRWYLRGAEAYAVAKIDTLMRDAAAARIDESAWQGQPFTFPLDDGVMTITLWDGGNCFNLNSLAQVEEGTGALRDSALGRVVFTRLLDVLSVRVEDQFSLATAVSDWIDSDTQEDTGGAEDAAYLSGAAPYRTANTLMADVAELRRVRGVTPEVARALAPYVCVRPTTRANPINVNTLRVEQAPILAAALGGFLSVRDAEDIVRQRPRGGWEDVEAFLGQARLGGLERSEGLLAAFTTDPQYYVMSARVRRGEASESCSALLSGGSGRPRILRRVCGVGAAERVL